jgi:hypothetical protein
VGAGVGAVVGVDHAHEAARVRLLAILAFDAVGRPVGIEDHHRFEAADRKVGHVGEEHLTSLEELALLKALLQPRPHVDHVVPIDKEQGVAQIDLNVFVHGFRGIAIASLFGNLAERGALGWRRRTSRRHLFEGADDGNLLPHAQHIATSRDGTALRDPARARCHLWWCQWRPRRRRWYLWRT